MTKPLTAYESMSDEDKRMIDNFVEVYQLYKKERRCSVCGMLWSEHGAQNIDYEKRLLISRQGGSGKAPPVDDSKYL